MHYDSILGRTQISYFNSRIDLITCNIFTWFNKIYQHIMAEQSNIFILPPVQSAQLQTENIEPPNTLQIIMN